MITIVTVAMGNKNHKQRGHGKTHFTKSLSYEYETWIMQVHERAWHSVKHRLLYPDLWLPIKKRGRKKNVVGYFGLFSNFWLPWQMSMLKTDNTIRCDLPANLVVDTACNLEFWNHLSFFTCFLHVFREPFLFLIIKEKLFGILNMSCDSHS